MKQPRPRLITASVACALVAIGARVLIQGSEGVPAAGITCDLQQYQPMTGLTAAVLGNLLAVTWGGADGAEVRARYPIDNAQPTVRDLAVRKAGGQWAVLAENLAAVRRGSGIRRFSSQQGEPLESIGILTPERAEKEKWYAYRDAPLYIRVPRPPAAVAGRAQEAAAVMTVLRQRGEEQLAAAVAAAVAVLGPECSSHRLYVAATGGHQACEFDLRNNILHGQDGWRADRSDL